MEVHAKPSEGFLFTGETFVKDFVVPSFREGGSSSLAHFVEHYQHLGFVVILCIGGFTYGEVGCHGQDPSCGIPSFS